MKPMPPSPLRAAVLGGALAYPILSGSVLIEYLYYGEISNLSITVPFALSMIFSAIPSELHLFQINRTAVGIGVALVSGIIGIVVGTAIKSANIDLIWVACAVGATGILVGFSSHFVVSLYAKAG